MLQKSVGTGWEIEGNCPSIARQSSATFVGVVELGFDTATDRILRASSRVRVTDSSQSGVNSNRHSLECIDPIFSSLLTIYSARDHRNDRRFFFDFSFGPGQKNAP
jgi:hypothetical protein